MGSADGGIRADTLRRRRHGVSMVLASVVVFSFDLTTHGIEAAASFVCQRSVLLSYVMLQAALQSSFSYPTA